MTKVLEGGPWLIRKVPLFLNVWSPSVSLKKEGIKSIPVWVKLHNVPISVYTDDGLSLLASKIGTPKRLDSYTADMCAENWGRSSFARALIEVNADNELKDHIIVAIPKLDEDGYITERINVEYEWKPHRCSTCCVFGHSDLTCAKNVNEKKKQVVVDEEGFVTDKRRTARGGTIQKKQKAKFIYRPKSNKTGTSTSGTKDSNSDRAGPSTSGTRSGTVNVKTSNAFDVLDSGEGDGNESIPGNVDGTNEKDGYSDHGIDDILDDMPTEMAKFMSNKQQTNFSEGASTPGATGLNG
ncbi:uncharacterized protein LOC110924678 [Helianthus annuus]|uniref:uncharacterized protein LOC110924678 n=1 Tax=Helianthus annuus TaxID=4232 RepID=UPI000B8FBDCE|nr:uncharacterized protein LOC110924678 [Helianthus annuus]